MEAHLPPFLVNETIHSSLSMKLMHQCLEKLILFLEPSEEKSKIGLENWFSEQPEERP